MSRVLRNGENQITQSYAAHCEKVEKGIGWAKGVDIVKRTASLDDVCTHSPGTVIKVVHQPINGKKDYEGMGYGSYVMVAHDNHNVTLYAHLQRIYVEEGQKLKQSQPIGYMGNSGASQGGHCHIEWRVYADDVMKLPKNRLHKEECFEWKDITPFLDKDLPIIIQDGKHRVQTNAFEDKENAKAEVKRLEKDGYRTCTKLYDDGLIHVQVGAFDDKSNAEALAAELRGKGYSTFITTRNGVDIIL